MGCVIGYIKYLAELLHYDELPLPWLCTRRRLCCAMISAQDPKGNLVQSS